MDEKQVTSNNRNRNNCADFFPFLSATKTDLCLLLECLKFQMKSPDLQKQALLTINSICEKREDNVDLLREMGGVAFIYNLSKSSIVQSAVKETALFTLGILAEANVYCKNSLCRKEIFTNITVWLMNEGTPLTQRRVIVYLLFVLVANNKLGQTLAQTSGCLDILLDLFRTTFPLSKGDDLRTVSQTYHFWASVSSTLCGCVNNPQNEEGQRICVVVFPIIDSWLQQISLPCIEIFQPICSFIAMTVANNLCVQESFSASGGLKTLTLALVRLASSADTSFLSCQLSVIISKTLSACITDNSVLASSLAQYVVVPKLFSLLASSHLAPDDRLSILLNIGQCTVASVDHQSQLVQCGGLPLIITLLIEDTNEEIRKAATFILQTSKQATMCFRGNNLIAKEAENEDRLVNIEDYKSSAQDMLRRINLIEKSLLEVQVEDDLEDIIPPNSTGGQGHPSQSQGLSPSWQRRKSMKPIHTLKHVPQGSDSSSEDQRVMEMYEKENNSDKRKITSSSTCKGGANLMSSAVRSLERANELQTAKNELFKKKQKTIVELQKSEIRRAGEIPAKEHSVSHIRCAGCVLPFEEVTSRTFASLKSLSHNSCDMHTVLQEATEQFRVRCLNSVLMKKHQDVTEESKCAETRRVSSTEQRTSEYWNCISLTPIHRRSTKKTFTLQSRTGISLIPIHRRPTKETFTLQSLAPLKRHHLPEDRHPTSDLAERRGRSNSGHDAVEDHSKMSSDRSSTRKKRQEFSREEVGYLLSGVKKYGFSWNSILWSYPFQPGRTNVDLAKKYRRLMKCKSGKDGCK
ncbi:telomere repeats-binding bouquet formation protein 1 [Cololabis saira]|uniref:telomere repeats-binding bouquet formation protein 1 n=1 Tax=Cololabis saira TaxID=129043 RepID=UPI002AD2C13D|nr:telomere repeats-binding bouquet formation protein 1 [Cololabis saira]